MVGVQVGDRGQSHHLYDPARYTRGDPLGSPKLILLYSAVPVVLHTSAQCPLTPTSYARRQFWSPKRSTTPQDGNMHTIHSIYVDIDENDMKNLTRKHDKLEIARRHPSF